ncbi:MAG: hypothetical protein HFH85_12890 [Lachnospiraceae bacterium]|nr:hypothetical protein [Lachnospiraceae bacterium]
MEMLSSADNTLAAITFQASVIEKNKYSIIVKPGTLTGIVKYSQEEFDEHTRTSNAPTLREFR